MTYKLQKFIVFLINKKMRRKVFSIFDCLTFKNVNSINETLLNSTFKAAQLPWILLYLIIFLKLSKANFLKTEYNFNKLVLKTHFLQ